MPTVWKLGGLTVKDLLGRVWSEIQDDGVFGRAAQLSFYFLLALFPLLIFLTSVIGLVIGVESELRRSLLTYLGQVMPREAFRLTASTLTEISVATSGAKISFGILATLWAASNGMGAITDALNVAYDVKESRPWWLQRVTAILLTFALSILIVGALIVILAGRRIVNWIADTYAYGSMFTFTWNLVQWPMVLAFVLLAFALIYYLAPNVEEQKWKWVTPGSVVGVLLWLLVSFGFRVYLYFFDTYSNTYGSLGAVIILMLWLYLTGAAVLIGGEVNAVIEDSAAEAGAPDAKHKGETTT